LTNSRCAFLYEDSTNKKERIQSMRRDGEKFEKVTNKTLRYCQQCKTTSLVDMQYYHCSSNGVRNINSNRENIAFNVEKNGRWEIVETIAKHIKQQKQSQKKKNKIEIGGYYNYDPYNGYPWARKEKAPPKHSKFSKPDFVYQPKVKYCRVDHDELFEAMEQGAKYLKDNGPEKLFDIDEEVTNVALVYLVPFIHSSANELSFALKHAFGGSAGEFYMECTGDHCHYGVMIDSEVKKTDAVAVYVFTDPFVSDKKGRWCCCRGTYSGNDETTDKETRTRRKTERREGKELTKRMQNNEL
jgi:hypothetical protein